MNYLYFIAKYALDEGMEAVQERFQNKLNIIDERLENIKSGFESIIESLHKERKLNGKEKDSPIKKVTNEEEEDDD